MIHSSLHFRRVAAFDWCDGRVWRWIVWSENVKANHDCPVSKKNCPFKSLFVICSSHPHPLMLFQCRNQFGRCRWGVESEFTFYIIEPNIVFPFIIFWTEIVIFNLPNFFTIPVSHLIADLELTFRCPTSHIGEFISRRLNSGNVVVPVINSPWSCSFIWLKPTSQRCTSLTCPSTFKLWIIKLVVVTLDSKTPALPNTGFHG